MMYEHKIVEAATSRDAEALMNQYAAQGWRVVSVPARVHWTNHLVITLEKAE